MTTAVILANMYWGKNDGKSDYTELEVLLMQDWNNQKIVGKRKPPVVDIFSPEWDAYLDLIWLFYPAPCPGYCFLSIPMTFPRTLI